MTKNKLTLGLPYTMKGVHADDLMLTACLAASRKRKGLDAIDKAFLKALKPYWTVKHALSEFKIIDFSPFNPVSKRVTAVARAPGGELFTCVKGSPTAVLDMVLAAKRSSKTTIIKWKSSQVEASALSLSPGNEVLVTGKFWASCRVQIHHAMMQPQRSVKPKQWA